MAWGDTNGRVGGLTPNQMVGLRRYPTEMYLGPAFLHPNENSWNSGAISPYIIVTK